jgi:hypothetical protein
MYVLIQNFNKRNSFAFWHRDQNTDSLDFKNQAHTLKLAAILCLKWSTTVWQVVYKQCFDSRLTRNSQNLLKIIDKN